MDLELKNKIFVVTGGDRGIGLAISKLLAKEGAIPIIIARDTDSLQAAKNSITESGGKVEIIKAELTDYHDCQSAIGNVIQNYKQIDGLINNAGVNDSISLHGGNPKEFMISIERNLLHYYVMAQLVLPSLKISQGAIVNISSKTALTGQGFTSGYAAANGGRNALTREWAVELLPYNIRVNSIIVAECDTPQYQKWISAVSNSEEKLKEIQNRIPLNKRLTQPEEIANSVLFLLSPKSSHTTGQLLFVDGGYVHLDRAIQ